MSIKVEHLSKIFGSQKAVNDISFEIGKGSIVGFLGPNGAGKSTTMKMITTYIPPTSGSITVCGFDVITQPMEVKRRVGYLPESNPLYYDMYIREYLEFAAGIHKIGKGKKARVDEMIEVTGLQKEVHKKIGKLSKGYKQRVGIAQAMIHNPEVLILDEPTSGLDPNQIAEIRDLILRLGTEKTVLLSTHIMQEVQAMCGRVIIINNGTIVADDAIDQIHQVVHPSDTTALVLQLDKIVPRPTVELLTQVTYIKNLDEYTWQLSTQNVNALRKEIMTWAVQRDISIVAMNNQVESLEEVFRNLTQKPTS
jgi:ABC-2 type transport system ATP-binding protein